MSAKPVTFIWSEAEKTMRPFGVGMERRASEYYGDGEIVRLAEPQDRTQQSEGHYFAVLHELWQSVPEKLRGEEEWAESEEHMRKFALIKTGFYNVQEYPCDTAVEAKKWAARLKPMDEYSLVTVNGTVVRRFTAKSQSRNAMPGKGEFHDSKQKVLGYLADLIGLPPDAEQRTTR